MFGDADGESYRTGKRCVSVEKIIRKRDSN